jgi:DNA anti-recombination protein RmuC
MNQRQQMQQQIQSMDETIKNLQGDLQTATRESISDRKRTEVEKFKSRLNEVESNASADRRINKNKLNDKVLLELEKLRGEIKVMESEMRSSSQQDKTSKE